MRADALNKNRQTLTIDFENSELYTEKITIWEKGILKDILVVIFNNKMNFIYLNKEIQFMKPICIITDIELMQKSTM